MHDDDILLYIDQYVMKYIMLPLALIARRPLEHTNP